MRAYKYRSEAAPFCGCVLRSHEQKLLKNGTLNKRIALLCLLCTCIQLISGYPLCYSLVYGPFPNSAFSIHEDVSNNKFQF